MYTKEYYFVFIIYALYVSFLIYILKGIYNNSHISDTPTDLYKIPHIAHA